MTERRVVLVGYPGVQTLDLVGPAEVFASANLHRAPGQPRYRVVLASPRGGTLRTGSGLALAESIALARLRGPIDTLVVAGGTEAALRALETDGVLTRWIWRRRDTIRRLCSVCTGAFALAASGVAQGRRIATHWGACDALEKMFPDAIVERDAIFVIDPPIYSSAGVTAAIDLTLALVEEDLGRRVALAIARDLVLFLRRPGGQSQFSAGLVAQEAASDRLRDLVAWIHEHPDADLRADALAKRAGISPRHFARVFQMETGTTPGRFAEAVRVERAKLYLEESDWSLTRVAEKSGLGSEDSLLRSFRRRLGITPRDYRARFTRQRGAGPGASSSARGRI